MENKTIKKAFPMLVGGLAVALAVSVVPPSFFARADEGIKNIEDKTEEVVDIVNVVENEKYITLEEAIKIALEKVNDKEAQVTDYEIELTYDDPHYEIEVKTKYKKFEIKVHGITGSITDVDVEAINPYKFKDKVKENKGRFISKYEAKMETLKEVNDKTAYISGFEIELEREIPHYLIEVKTFAHKYLMKIDAEKGEVFDKVTSIIDINDKDDDDKKDDKIRGNSDKINKEDKKNNGKSNNGKGVENRNKNKDKNKKDKDQVLNVNYIKEEVAIQKALEKIGTTATLKKIKFDKDNNPPKYEIEMYNENYEYEIEVHGITGAIIDFERDNDLKALEV